MYLLELVYLAVFNDSWVNVSTWRCLKEVEQHFLAENPVIFSGDNPQILNKPVYTMTTPAPSKIIGDVNVVLVLRTVSDWRPSELTGNSVIITEKPEIVNRVWPKYKRVPLVVIVQEARNCTVYGWTPLKFPSCNAPPQLQLLSSCEEVASIDFQALLPNLDNIIGCELEVSLIPCPTFVGVTKSENLVGSEVMILRDLMQLTGMNVCYHNRPHFNSTRNYFYYVKYFFNGSYSGVWKLLDDRTVDMAGSCQSVGLDKLPFEALPSHIEDPTSWHLPGPQQLSLSSGFMTAFSGEMWKAVATIFIATFLFLNGVFHFKSVGDVFLWTLIRMLSMPGPPLRETYLLRSFSLLLEFCALILTTIYKSRLLYALFIKPMLIFKTGETGAHYGLKAYMRYREAALLNNTHTHLTHHLKEPGQLNVTQTFDFELLVENKTAMMMARTIIDQAQIRLKYPDVAYSSAVNVEKTPFTINNVAFLMTPHHPLLHAFSIRILEIIQAGLPNFYLKQELAKLPGKGKDPVEIDDEPLLWGNLASLFYMWISCCAVCVIVFVGEIIFWYIHQVLRSIQLGRDNKKPRRVRRVRIVHQRNEFYPFVN